MALAALVITGQAWLRVNRPALDLAASVASVRWEPERIASLRHPRARIAGAWRLQASDPRVGGFSGLAVDRGRLLGLTDSGMLVWLPLPPGEGVAIVRPLPAVAGRPGTKIGRDSEALARSEDGWWVAFEQRHHLIRYDRDLREAVQRIALEGRRLRANRGVEAISAGAGRLWAYPERSGISDAVAVTEGHDLLLHRRFGVRGFATRIAGVAGGDIALSLAPLDNAEGLAAQSLAGGAMRLWVITDNDQRRWKRTLLVAIDLPPASGG
ncbi:MAG TPA: esterase-like activity of phytase family protein [Sphingomicrobium sp.]|nr:esterase-like activity of phytase family protein [Sphingomicrobium sp.]